MSPRKNSRVARSSKIGASVDAYFNAHFAVVLSCIRDWRRQFNAPPTQPRLNACLRGLAPSALVKPDISAPGVSITSADAGTGSGYSTSSGTSMATPFAAGTIALMLDADPTLTYTEAINILEKCTRTFEYPLKWGTDLQSEHERFLSEEHFKSPIILTDYPKEIKAFYMRENDDGKTVAALDVLVPKVGEIIGGSQREERYDLLEAKFKQHSLDLETYQWYLDLRKYGTVPHGGFGLGFERLVQFATGIDNIRDAIAFPRIPGSCTF